MARSGRSRARGRTRRTTRERDIRTTRDRRGACPGCELPGVGEGEGRLRGGLFLRFFLYFAAGDAGFPRGGERGDEEAADDDAGADKDGGGPGGVGIAGVGGG